MFTCKVQQSGLNTLARRRAREPARGNTATASHLLWKWLQFLQAGDNLTLTADYVEHVNCSSTTRPLNSVLETRFFAQQISNSVLTKLNKILFTGLQKIGRYQNEVRFLRLVKI